ncbi:MAG: histidine kinase dimerization/phosphoacceptor domain -containing protein [Thermodesulfobacteriota bacterium]|nr:histidine kinase dimerization/phosphoacceptor domain -containing protein [Thermodesulfobacteriota bacterium]
MLRTINRNFYTIAGILVLLFGLGYTVVAFFLHEQGQNAIREQEAVFIDREIRSLHDLFFEIRFWDRAVFSQDYPEADKKFGALLEQMRKRLMVLNSKPVSVDVKEKLEKASKFLTEYEKDFNRIIQLKTKQRLNRTRMDTSYRSLSSNVLRSNETSLLKPFFILTHFQKGYRIFRRETEYQALKVAIDSFGRKFLLANLMDERMKDYLKAFSDLLDQDFSLERQIRLINVRFDQISTQLMDLFSATSREAERSLRNEFQEAEESRNELNIFFLISIVLSIMILMVVLIVMAMKIIRPIRSMAKVMREVKTGNIEARFDSVGNKNDEIMQLGWSFNDMLDTVEENNQQLVSYQDELENKVSELALRETELKKHREDLEILVKERTGDLTKANQELQQEIIERKRVGEALRESEARIGASLKEKEVLLREIHHRVKNNMQVIVSLLRMHSRRIDDTRLRQIFDECRDRVNAMSLIHEDLYQSEDLARIDFEIYLKKLCRNLSQAHGASGKGIEVSVDKCNVMLGMDQGIAVGIVISELITNAFKHAFPLGKGGSVSVNLSCREGEEVELIVQDDGKGLPPEIDILNPVSLGLRLTVAAVTRELDGSIEVERDKGTRFIIRFKGKTYS